MQPYLVFTLAASLGAMGELAGHERRGSLSWPGRSAIVGLLGAALGIDRQGDFSVFDPLRMAVAIFQSGHPLRDYHTVETVPSAAAKRPNSRPQALRAASGQTKTSITLRDYRCNPLFGVALWGDTQEKLEALRDALSRPHYTLYLGRKACPLNAPPGARVVTDQPGPEAALRSLTIPPWRWPRLSQAPLEARTLVCEAEEADSMQTLVHDLPTDRRAWHFAARRVALRPVSIVPEGGR